MTIKEGATGHYELREKTTGIVVDLPCTRTNARGSLYVIANGQPPQNGGYHRGFVQAENSGLQCSPSVFDLEWVKVRNYWIVEYDFDYWGGDYSDVGLTFAVSGEIISEMAHGLHLEQAIKKAMDRRGIPSVHLINYREEESL